jgi:hypothetical protein
MSMGVSGLFIQFFESLRHFVVSIRDYVTNDVEYETSYKDKRGEIRSIVSIQEK